MTEFIQVTTAIDSREGAQKIAHLLVERRLAACVHVSGPITSTYWWQGKMETSQEWMCAAKTRKELYGKVEKAIRKAHPNDRPKKKRERVTKLWPSMVKYGGEIEPICQ